MPSRIGKQDVGRELEVVFSDLFTTLRPVLGELVGKLQRAQRADEYVHLLSRLLREFLRYQMTQEKARQTREKRKQALKELIALNPKPVRQIAAVNAELDLDDFFDHALSCALHALRCVGDGIAWRTLEYDRRAITLLGSSDRVGRLTHDAGLQAETEALDQLWSCGQFAIHNDVTNCLRHGDLTIPAGINGNDSVGIAEIKASGRQRSVQQTRLNQTVEFLGSGFRPGPDGEPATRIVGPVCELRTYLAVVPGLIDRARRDGFASCSPHRCLTVAVADYSSISRDPALLDDWAFAAPRARGWDPEGPRVIQSLGLIRRVREQHDSFPFIAPWTIFPLDAEDVADLITGRLDICASINCDELQKTIAEAGMPNEVADRANANFWFLRVTDGQRTVTIPAVVREQMLTELLTPETVIDAALVGLAAAAEHDEEQLANTLVTYAGEKDVWQPAATP